MRFPLDWLSSERWYWITILGCFAVLAGPLMIIYIIVFLPAPLNAVAVFGLILGWSLAGGYKDWVKAEREEEKPSVQG
ncbi:MAG TPA: hypothetical protein VJ249_10560 [Candidatus Bathyarchaeia archaeon]|nr:hypothetical protein [Candidatus Bathyarchaeia archaeon]